MKKQREKKKLSKTKKIILSITGLFLAFIVAFVSSFFILTFPVADKIDDAIITKGESLQSIKERYTDVFIDNFETSQLNKKYWNFEGSKATRNNELQTYADSMKDGNVEISDGNLNIIAKKEERNGRNYTSASLTTQGKVKFRYGIFEIRAKLPTGRGVWPAFWLMGETNFFNMMMWPMTGEIDIMESICSKDYDRKIYSTIHYGKLFSQNPDRQGGAYYLPDKGKFCDDFHTFGVIITDSQMLFYVDDKIHTYLDITDKACDTFRKYDKYILLNLALGGEWAGQPTSETSFPATYSIDYVKIMQANT